MTPIRNLLSDAVRYGLAAGVVGIAGLASASAFAQDTTDTTTTPDSAKAKNLDRVEVIGSRIRRAVDTEPTQPVTTLTRADIAQTGLTSTYDVINHISASDGSGLSTVTTQTNGSDGSQFISLRNLGPQRTLILVDGKRWTTDGFGQVDLSSIPVAIIERIDVLKDGASAIYGSDAVAGVINIVTRKKFDGAEANWYYGQTSHGDGEQNAEDVTIGANGDRTNVVISLSRSEQKTIFAGNRSISRFPFAGCVSEATSSGCGSFYSQFGVFYGPTVPDTNTFNVLNHSADNKSWAPGTKPSDYHPFTNADRYNFAPVNYLQQPAVRNNLYAAGRFDITDNVSAYARVSYTQRQSSQQLAQVPTSLATSGGFGPQWKFGATADNIFNPFGGPVTTIGFRNVAVGPRHNNYDFNTLGSTAGLQGTFSFADRNFDWDVYGQYNSTRDTKIGLNYLNLFNLQKGLGPSFADAAGLHCGTYDAGAENNGAIAGCTPFNIFSGPNLGVGNSYVRSDDPTKKYTVTSADRQAMVDYVRYTEVSASGDKGINYGANLSGEIAPLQGGMLSFAAGVEQRRERFFNQTDALVSGGGSSDNFVQPTKGETKVTEEYFELDAPLLKDLPGAKELEFDAAVRKSKNTADGLIGSTLFATDQGSPTTKKFSVRWKPIDDLLIRASYGDTFRAPQVGDLFAGGSENFPIVNDPCNAVRIANIPAAGQALCHAQGVPANGYTQQNIQVRALAGGNPFLKPEHGHNFTAGFVFSPSFVSGLNFTADFWRIDLKDAIAAASAQTFVDNCYVKGDPNACAFVTRLPSGQLAVVQTGNLNQATLHVDGIDYGLTYKHDTAWGNFGVKWDVTNLRSETSQLGVGSPNVDVVGEYNGTPNWKWRSVTTFDWTRGDWDASWTVRYMSKQDENCKPLICNHPNDISNIDDVSDNGHGGRIVGFNRLGATTYHDVQIGWKAPWKAHLSLGARNVFGKEPPLAANAFANSFDAAYDLPGGPFYYFQYHQSF